MNMVNMSINTLEGPLDVLRQNEVNLITEVAETLSEISDNNTDEDRKRLLDVAQDLRELFFLVVIIGEFNAGKSTFVNALISEPLLPMGITPTTEAIELVRYSDTPKRTPTLRGDGIREWAHPNTGAPGVAIVDTPGTGSVFQKHESTAKSFLHRSDLVIFLISAKRAFAETERLYLELAKSYGKKIILVVNQSDLLDPGEQSQVRRFVEQQAKELLDLNPLVFMVSAKESLNATKENGPEASAGGIDAVKAHLRGVFNQTPPAKQKLLAQLDMVQATVKKYVDLLQNRSSTVSSDTAKVRDVQNELETQSVGLDAQLLDARTEIDKVFEGIRHRGRNFIDTNLSVRLFGRAPGKDQLKLEFQDVVIGRALRDIKDATEGYVNAVVDHSRMYWRGVIDRLNQLDQLLEQELGGLDSGVYAEQRESLQEAIRIAESELKSYSSGIVLNDIQSSFEENMNGLKGSLLASVGGIVGLILAIGAPGPLIGAAAAPLALPALVVSAPVTVLGGIATYRYYRRVTIDTKREFNDRIDRLEKTYHDALGELTRKERDRLTQYGKRILTPIFSRLEALTKRYDEQLSKMTIYNDRIEVLRKSIEDAR